MNLKEIRDSYIDDGMGFDAATARTCRDVVLTLIAASPMASHVTVKGGVVMQQVSAMCVGRHETWISTLFVIQ